jgi:WD40 repeat protein
LICSSNEKVYLGKINLKNKLKCYYLCEHKNKINIIFKLISGKFILGSSDKISIYFEDKEFYSEMFSIINNCEIKRISEILNKYFFIALEDKTFKIYDQKTFNLSFVLTNEFQIDDLCQFDNDNLISFSDREILIWSCQMDSNILLGSSIFILSH